MVADLYCVNCFLLALEYTAKQLNGGLIFNCEAALVDGFHSLVEYDLSTRGTGTDAIWTTTAPHIPFPQQLHCNTVFTATHDTYLIFAEAESPMTMF